MPICTCMPYSMCCIKISRKVTDLYIWVQINLVVTSTIHFYQCILGVIIPYDIPESHVFTCSPNPSSRHGLYYVAVVISSLNVIEVPCSFQGYQSIMKAFRCYAIYINTVNFIPSSITDFHYLVSCECSRPYNFYMTSDF